MQKKLHLLLEFINIYNRQDSHIETYLKFVGMTGFEPATTRPPDVYATGLRYIPIFISAKIAYLNLLRIRIKIYLLSLSGFAYLIPEKR